ncbi:carbohydrate-binding family 9-like protein [bacterium]|nr:carbohydrate-binding family 9-like protein [bacterium]
MKSILVKRISLNLSSEINDRGTETANSNRSTETEHNNCSTETESSNRKTAAEIGAAMDEAGVGYNWIDVAQWPERNNGYKPEVRFRIAYSQQMLFIEYYVKEANIKALYSEDKDSKPFKDSCCEFFFSPECNNNYYNMELNCIGKGTFAFRRGGRKGPKIAYGEEIMKRIFRYSTLGEAPIETSVKENGELFEWKLTVAIPLECFTETPMNELKGKTMRANFYKCGDDMPKPHFLTWNRIELDKPDFHTPDFFGALHFE